MRLHWQVEGAGYGDGEDFLGFLKSLPWLEGTVSVWAASEFETMRAMRRYFKKERDVPTANAYLSSYWKRGLQEDEHKRVKR